MQFHLSLPVVMEGDVGVFMSLSKYWPCESICADGKGSNMCYEYTVTVCVCHTRPDRWKDRSRERGRGLMNAGTVGEQVRDGERYFSPSLFPLSAGR